MPENQPKYSRDEAVLALTSYYEWLAELYLPASSIKYPPPGGWPEITPEYLAFMNKNDTVVDLLRHIPYIRRDDEFEPFHIYEDTSVNDYSGEFFRRFAVKPQNPTMADPMEVLTVVPSHVATIATTSGGRDGYHIFLDTERGTMIIGDFMEGPEPTKLSQQMNDEKDEWRAHATYTIKECFEVLKKQLLNFEVIPVGEKEVEMVKRCSTFNMEKIKGIYRSHGWPSSEYKKEECIPKVEEAWKKEIFGPSGKS